MYHSDDDFDDFLKLQATKTESDKSWTVEGSDISTDGFDLSVKNPNKAEEAPLRDPEEILAEIATLDAESNEILNGIRGMI